MKIPSKDMPLCRIESPTSPPYEAEVWDDPAPSLSHTRKRSPESSSTSASKRAKKDGPRHGDSPRRSPTATPTKRSRSPRPPTPVDSVMRTSQPAPIAPMFPPRSLSQSHNRRGSSSSRLSDRNEDNGTARSRTPHPRGPLSHSTSAAPHQPMRDQARSDLMAGRPPSRHGLCHLGRRDIVSSALATLATTCAGCRVAS